MYIKFGFSHLKNSYNNNIFVTFRIEIEKILFRSFIRYYFIRFFMIFGSLRDTLYKRRIIAYTIIREGTYRSHWLLE